MASKKKDIWQGRAHTALRYLKAAHIPWKRVLDRFLGGEILLFASGIAFSGLLTMVPLLLISAWALGTLLQSSDRGIGELQAILDTVFPQQPFAESIRGSILQIVTDIVEYRTSLGIVGFVVLVITATFLFDVLRTVLHRIYGLQRRRNIVVSFLHDLWFVSVTWVLLILTNLTLWAFSISQSLVADVPALKDLPLAGLTNEVPSFIVYVVTAGLFYFVYRHITDSKPPRVAAIASTVTMTVLWLLSGKIFAIYLGGFSIIGTIYGGYAFLFVLILWIYYSSLIFVVGGIIGQVYWEGLKERDAILAQRTERRQT